MLSLISVAILIWCSENVGAIKKKKENLGHWLPQGMKISESSFGDWYFKIFFYVFLHMCYLVSNEENNLFFES